MEVKQGGRQRQTGGAPRNSSSNTQKVIRENTVPGQMRKASAPTYDDYDIEDDDPELIALKQKKALAKKKQKQKEQLKAQQQKQNINKYLADDT